MYFHLHTFCIKGSIADDKVNVYLQARNLHIRTGADVYLKARYRGGRREPYIYSYGSDFSVDGEGEPASSTPVGAVDIAAVQQAIHASVKDAVSQIAEGNKKDITVPDSDVRSIL